ncbi:transcription elongation factor GreA [Peptococcaceae bacterium]|nr:transcription elongation factor GreA [Peptococcaceae bacterium]
MDIKKTIVTSQGLQQLEEELNTLKTVKRREIAQRIKQAIDFGDLSENSEYEDAKNEQAFIEGRILTIKKMLQHAKVIESENLDKEIVSLGSTILIKDLEFSDQFQYSIVGSVEADPTANKISNESPVGKEVLGKKKGEVIEVDVPAGKLQYEIIDIL